MSRIDLDQLCDSVAAMVVLALATGLKPVVPPRYHLVAQIAIWFFFVLVTVTIWDAVLPKTKEGGEVAS